MTRQIVPATGREQLINWWRMRDRGQIMVDFAPIVAWVVTAETPWGDEDGEYRVDAIPVPADANGMHRLRAAGEGGGWAILCADGRVLEPPMGDTHRSLDEALHAWQLDVQSPPEKMQPSDIGLDWSGKYLKRARRRPSG